METVKRKLHPSESLDDPINAKKARSIYEDYSGSDSSEHDNNNVFEDGATSRAADTPITPFSPSQNIYPSQRKTIACTWEGCDKKFNRPARLEAHIRSHKNERPFLCTYEGCDKAYTESKHLAQHIKGSHTKERPYECDWPECGKSFMTGTRLRRHEASHKGHERFVCTGFPPCTQTFRKHQTLERHVRADHLAGFAFPCTHVDPVTKEQCTAGFDNGGSLRKHQDRNHGAMRYFCEECTLPALAAEGPRQQLGFRTKAELNKHIKTTHLNCLFCDLSFSSQQDLAQHTELAHHEAVISTAKPMLILKCDVPECDREFTKRFPLEQHIRVAHEGMRYTCGEFDLSTSTHCPGWTGENACGKGYFTKVNLEDHVRTQHLGLKSIVNANRPKAQAIKQEARDLYKDLRIDPVALVTGTAYAQDEARDMPCPVSDCDWKYTRQFDLEHHMFLKHPNYAFGNAEEYPDHHDAMLDQDFYNNGLSWPLANNTPGDSPFWFGADDGAMEIMNGGPENWSYEQQEEMRRILHDDDDDIDRDDQFAARYPDPEQS